ncbi:MAG: ATP-binding protein, partial [Candidatus Micrarchaeota archaeon]
MAFDVEAFIRNASEDVRRQIGDERALIAVSGGVDSTTVAVLVARAVGEKLSCVFIDTGFMREREPEKVKEGLAKFGVELEVVNARERFFKALEGLEDAEEKRKAFRETFYRLFGEIVRGKGCKILIQGTIAPDWIETKGGIKSQHNVLAQIGIDTSKEYGFRILEPLLYLYKDQVRKVGEALGLPPEFYQRQPFPGPGLLVRVV